MKFLGNIIGLFFCLISIFMISGVSDTMTRPKEILLILGMMSIPAISFLKLPEKIYFNRFLFFLYFYILAHFSFTFLSPLVLNHDFQVKLNLWTFIPSLTTIFMIPFILFLIRYTKELSWVVIAKFICCASLIVSGIALAQYLNFNSIPFLTSWSGYAGSNLRHDLPFTLTSTIGNPTLMSNYLAVTSPVFLIFKKRIYKIGFLFNFIVSILTRSIASVIGFILAIVIFLIFRKRKTMALILFSSLVLFCILFSFIFNEFLIDPVRILIWKTTLESIGNYWIFGKGLGTVARDFAYSPIINNLRWDDPHNFLIFIFYETGIIGILLTIYWIGYFLMRMIYSKKTTLIAGYASVVYIYLFISLFNNQTVPSLLAFILSVASVENQIA